jgi:hypothetical protein
MIPALATAIAILPNCLIQSLKYVHSLLSFCHSRGDLVRLVQVRHGLGRGLDRLLEVGQISDDDVGAVPLEEGCRCFGSIGCHAQYCM